MLFWGAFLALALGTVAMALYVLREEKQLSYDNYRRGFERTVGQIAARLRHPTGQLALINPPGAPISAAGPGEAHLHPLMLPFSAIDFDDPNKVQQAIEMSGCQVRYKDGSSLCVAIGSNPWAGGFIYLAGSFDSADLVAHPRTELTVDGAHRARVSVSLRGEHYAWIAPFETTGADNPRGGLRGRLTGYADTGEAEVAHKALREFRGWIWQSPLCTEVPRQPEDCVKRSLFSIRLPIPVLAEALFEKRKPDWPPADLSQIAVRVEMLPPGDGPALLDSERGDATPPFSLQDLAPLLLPGETLSVRKEGEAGAPVVTIRGVNETEVAAPWLTSVVRRLVVEGNTAPIVAQEVVATPMGNYALTLTGDARSVNKTLASVATRVSWFVGAMLLAITLAWLVIEAGIIRRIAILTKRATRVSRTMKSTQDLARFDIADQKGSDELGILARCLAELLQRVQEDVAREKIRAEQEKDMWHAVGHEIMSPLQSLKALHPEEGDASHRYIQRMQQAIRVLYGTASPSEAFELTTLQVETLDIAAFLQDVARNAPCEGITDVVFEGAVAPLMVKAEAYALEDVVTHILRNADRYRTPGSAIRLRLQATPTSAVVEIFNQGCRIPDALIDKVFEYGVSDPEAEGTHGNRGQGLFVAKTYMAKMGGTVAVFNRDDGVAFELSLIRA